MQKGTLTRDQAVAIVGIEAVNAVEATNCEPTNRVGYNGATQGDDLTEWSASASAEDKDGIKCTVIVYYYTTQDDDRAMSDAGGDGSVINWTIAGYEVV